MTTNQEPVNQMAMTVDPVITWLEQIRDFIGTTPQSKEMAQRTIDRLRPPALDVDAVIGGILDDLGTLRATRGGVVSDGSGGFVQGGGDVGYYGGSLVCESMTARNAMAVSFLPRLITAARENAVGRRVLEQLATAISQSNDPLLPLADRLDLTIRLARLADEVHFSHDALHLDYPTRATVTDILRAIVAGIFSGSVVDSVRGAVSELRSDGTAS